VLAGVGLADQEAVGIDPDRLGVGQVEGVLGVDEQPRPPGLLRLGDEKLAVNVRSAPRR
jgi:hypothetical protein